MASRRQPGPEHHATSAPYLLHPPILTGTAVLSARLKLIGSCRNAGDQERVKSLRQLAAELGISEHVDFCVNAPWDEVRSP